MLVFSNEFEITSLVSAFHYDFPESFHYEGEAHDGWEFVYAESGTLLISAGSRKILLKKGQLICHKPMEYHSLQPYNGCASAIIFCFICNSPNMVIFEKRIINLNRQQLDYIYRIAEYAKQVLMPKDPLQISRDGFMEKKSTVNHFNEHQIKSSIEAFMLACSDVDDIIPKEQSFGSKQLAKDICQYLIKHRCEKIRIADIALNFSYSATSIKKIFRFETGHTVIGYLNMLRIDDAKEMLIKNKYTINEISENLGFTSPSYFSTFFKKQTGISPSQFIQDHIFTESK